MFAGVGALGWYGAGCLRSRAPTCTVSVACAWGKKTLRNERVVTGPSNVLLLRERERERERVRGRARERERARRGKIRRGQ